MKAKQIVTVLLSFTILFLSAQQKNNCHLTPYKAINDTFLVNGNRYCEDFTFDSTDGFWMIYDKYNFRLMETIHTLNGKRHGMGIRFAYEGNIEAKAEYQYGKKNGIEIQYEYYYKNNVKLLDSVVSQFMDGEKHGKEIEYNNGEIDRSREYKNGKKHGIELERIGTGDIWDIHTYNNGQLDGKYIDYYRVCEKIYKDGYYKDGKFTGVLNEYYSRNYNLKHEWIEKDGELISEKVYWENNQLMAEIYYENGVEKSGSYFYANGNSMSRRKYRSMSWEAEKSREKRKEILLGNCWNFGIQSDFDQNQYLGLDVGRTHGEMEYYSYWATSYGLGYTKSLNSKAGYMRAFAQGDVLFLSVRLEYLQKINSSEKYLRPGVGLNLLKFVDILYNYSIPLTPEPNMFKHGLTLKASLFYPFWPFD